MAPAPLLDKDIILVLVENSLPLTKTCHVKPEICYMLSRTQVAENYTFWETGSTLRKRIRILNQHINQPEYRKLSVSEHLDLCGKKSLTVFPFYEMYKSNTLKRRDIEKNILLELSNLN